MVQHRRPRLTVELSRWQVCPNQWINTRHNSYWDSTENHTRIHTRFPQGSPGNVLYCARQAGYALRALQRPGRLGGSSWPAAFARSVATRQTRRMHARAG
jgi:hypothetical protein